MLATKTSHKRRRSSARGDASRASNHADRAIVTVAGSSKGKQRAEDDDDDLSWSWRRLEKMAESHPLNHSMQLLLPGITNEEQGRELLKDLPRSSRSYLVRTPITLFLDPIFAAAHIKRGKLIALSSGGLESDDVICLDGQGILYLSLSRDTYQTLGLVGQALKQSRTSSGKGRDRLSGRMERWMVRIDLLAPSFVPGKPGFDRTLARLREWDARRAASGDARSGSWDILFCWTDGLSCFGKEMHFPPQSVLRQNIWPLDAEPSMTITNDSSVPCLGSDWSRGWSTSKQHGQPSDSDEWSEQLDCVAEWAALTALSAECVRSYSRPTIYNSYAVEQDQANGTSIAKIRYEGFLPSELCIAVLRTVRSHILRHKDRDTAGYAVVTCSGFTNAPVAWTYALPPSTQPPPSISPETENLIGKGKPGDSIDDAETSGEELPLHLQTGPKARQHRQQIRAKRGTISREQVGCQVRQPGASDSNGWQTIVLGGEHRAEYISIEDIGGCLKC